MSQFSDFAAEALAVSLEIDGGEFTYSGSAIPAAIDLQGHTLTTAKSSFPGAAYPPIGASIIVAGKRRQVKALANSSLVLLPGGTREDKPFVDDPGDPGLLVTFGSFAK